MIYFLLGVIILLQAVGLYRSKPATKTLPKPTDDHIRDTLKKHFEGCGLNAEQFGADYDLASTGKLGELIIHTSAQLGRPIRTVRDVHDLLVK